MCSVVFGPLFPDDTLGVVASSLIGGHGAALKELSSFSLVCRDFNRVVTLGFCLKDATLAAFPDIDDLYSLVPTKLSYKEKLKQQVRKEKRSQP